MKELNLLLATKQNRDIDLIQQHLQQFGFIFTITPIATLENFTMHLMPSAWDVIIAEYEPYFLLKALTFCQKQQNSPPFIILADIADEATIVECLHAGACDFITRSRLERLGPALLREQAANRLAQFGSLANTEDGRDRFRYLSQHDFLTELYNRSYFEAEMLRLSQEKYAPIGIIVGDIDGLKLVNDTLGNETGDVLLMIAAGLLREAAPPQVCVARTGGDEFAILLPNTTLAALEIIAKEIRYKTALINQTQQSLNLSLSIGYALSDCNPHPDLIACYKQADTHMYREKLHRNKSARSSIVQTAMKLLEARDFITEGHADRMQDLAEALGELLALPQESLSDLRLLAQFHDIGKIGIPDRILFKPDSLTTEEYSEMQRHCEIGYRIAYSAPDLIPIAEQILKHHEWWNGQGYPFGLAGEEIPLACRILSIVDAYDAMTSDRPYRKAMPSEQALQELQRCAGKQFDPTLVEVFTELIKKHISP
ncbi:MAG: diguanylate cyclase [Sporomusaceae bacterium]|nr:diguanylate cyclase [Sporomusaceae bacterium]